MFYSNDVEFGYHYDTTPSAMSEPSKPPIFATVVFAPRKPGAAISIPPLAEPTSFVMRGAGFFTADGRELVIVDDQARARVLKAFQDLPDSVFVVETGPLGFVADYPIASAAQL